jgi:hypothetical protein
MPTYMQGAYVGSESRLEGKTALLRPGAPGQLLAQFDDIHLSLGWVLLGHGWHPFDKDDFEISPQGDRTSEGESL